MNRLAAARRRLRRAVLARRRLLAALTAAAAVVLGLQHVSGPPPRTTPVLTAARDIPGGTVLRPGDLATVAFQPGSVPAGVVPTAGQLIGRTVAAPLRAGEPVTDVRLLGGSLLQGYPGMVAAPVRIPDAGAVALLQVGDRVDVIAADPQGAADAQVVVAAAPVIALPSAAEDDTELVSGGLVVLAVPEGTARALAAAGVSAYLSVVLTR